MRDQFSTRIFAMRMSLSMLCDADCGNKFLVHMRLLTPYVRGGVSAAATGLLCALLSSHIYMASQQGFVIFSVYVCLCGKYRRWCSDT